MDKVQKHNSFKVCVCLSWGAHPEGWTDLSCKRSEFLPMSCIIFFYIMLVCIFKSKLLFTEVYVHDSPVGLGTVQQIMSTLCTSDCLDT
jgi:hypothetical protein